MRSKNRNRGVARAWIEKLEERKLLTAQPGDPDSIVEVAGVVTITGTIHSDEISVVSSGPNWTFDIITPGFATITASIVKTSITQISVHTDPSTGTPDAGEADFVNFGGFNFNAQVGITGGVGNDSIIGSNSPNTIFGNGGNNVLFGGTANDTIVGGTGNDQIHGGAGQDVLLASSGDCVIQGGAGNDNISAASTSGHDTLRGGPGDDTITGGTGDSVIMANDGNDSLTANTGNDTVIGGSGNDIVQGGAATGSDTLTSGGGNDFISGNNVGFLSLSGVTVPANTGNALITADGSAGADTFGAVNGADTILGSSSSSDYYSVNDTNAQIDVYNGGGIAQEDYFGGSPSIVLNISLTINYVVGGTPTAVQIPTGAGSNPFGGRTSPAVAINSSGDIQFQANAPRTFTLQDFFNHWGVPLSSTGVGQFRTLGFGHTFGMTVNGVPNTQFGAYHVQNGDSIILTFTQ